MDARLLESIRSGKTMLFAGAGLSQNLALPSWGGLVDEVAKQLGFDPTIFKAQGDYLELFEYYYLEQGTLGPLRSWMDTNWHTGIDIGESKIHELITNITFPKIYTTNYDSWIERAHDHYGKRYHKVTNSRGLASAKPGVRQIIKFHGDFDDDQSLVLTESNYFNRLSFESPLDIQLRADMLSHSLLYIGYSLRDINLRFLLHKLQALAVDAKLDNATPTSFVFLSRPNIIQERILRHRNVIPIVSEADDPSVGLLNFLQELYDETRSE